MPFNGKIPLFERKPPLEIKIVYLESEPSYIEPIITICGSYKCKEPTIDQHDFYVQE